MGYVLLIVIAKDGLDSCIGIFVHVARHQQIGGAKGW